MNRVQRLPNRCACCGRRAKTHRVLAREGVAYFCRIHWDMLTDFSVFDGSLFKLSPTDVSFFVMVIKAFGNVEIREGHNAIQE